MFDVNHTFYTEDDDIGEVEPLELHDEDFEKVEEGVDVEINKTTISQSVKLVNMFTLYEELSKINHEKFSWGDHG